MKEASGFILGGTGSSVHVDDFILLILTPILSTVVQLKDIIYSRWRLDESVFLKLDLTVSMFSLKNNAYS